MNQEFYNNGTNIESILFRDETILWQGKPNKNSYIIKLIFSYLYSTLIIGFILGVLFLFVYLTSFELIACIFFGIFALVFIIPLIISYAAFIPKILEVKNLQYVVTDKRLLYKNGVVGIDYKSLFYKDVQKVTIKVNILDKLFKDGTIKLIGSTSVNIFRNTSIDIHCIDNCYDLYKKLYKIVLDIQTDIEYPNALRPENNSRYTPKNGKVRNDSITNDGLKLEDILAKDEEVLWRGRPKKSIYFLGRISICVGVFLGTCFVMGICLVVSSALGPLKENLTIILTLGVFFILVNIILSTSSIKECIEYKNIEYALTNNRIIIKNGIIGIDYIGIQYKDIVSVKVTTDVIDKICGIGHIEIQLKKDTVTLNGLGDCYETYKIVHKIIVDIQNDIEFPNALQSDENLDYNKKQEKE